MELSPPHGGQRAGGPDTKVPPVGRVATSMLVDIYGGSVDVRSQAGWETFEVRLQPALPVPQQSLLDQRA